MIEKLEPIKAFNCSDTPQAKMQHHSYHNDCINKINELVDAVNGILAAQEQYATIYKEDIVPMLTPENEEPDYITTSYPTDGKQKKYYGQNGACVETDFPLPAGYVITIRESETKGGDNE